MKFIILLPALFALGLGMPLEGTKVVRAPLGERDLGSYTGTYQNDGSCLVYLGLVNNSPYYVGWGCTSYDSSVDAQSCTGQCDETYCVSVTCPANANAPNPTVPATYAKID
ncbi:hypothetical protein BGZ63DRAFT_406688 [Mariannaea sp. PMI_226]|nr:hypothetical protein BGZ63DRAFT_406688 [Mariannaea sp. PMI_226]